MGFSNHNTFALNTGGNLLVLQHLVENFTTRTQACNPFPLSSVIFRRCPIEAGCLINWPCRVGADAARRLTHPWPSTLTQGNSLCAQLPPLPPPTPSQSQDPASDGVLLSGKTAQKGHRGAHKKQEHVTAKNTRSPPPPSERFPTLSPSEPKQPIKTTISASFAPKT